MWCELWWVSLTIKDAPNSAIQEPYKDLGVG